jgi:hypothetical protein
VRGEFKETLDGNRFLLMDKSIARRERILVFSSDHQLDMLLSSPAVYMAGTFSESPHISNKYILYTRFYLIFVSNAAHISKNHFLF